MVVRRARDASVVRLVTDQVAGGEVGSRFDEKRDRKRDHGSESGIRVSTRDVTSNSAWMTDVESGIALGVHPRIVHIKAREHGWRTREETCRGGRRKLFNRLDVLSWKAQRDGTPLETPDPTLRQPVRPEEDILPTVPERARQEVYQRVEAVLAWEAWRRDKRGDDDAFVTAWLSTHPGMRLSRPTLYRWKAEHDQGGVNALVSGYFLRNADGPEIDQRLSMHFDKLWLHQNRRSVRWCYEATSVYAEELGAECPSLSTFHRHVDRIPRGTQVLARDGEKAWKDKIGPYMMRDTAALRSNEVWNSDHHQLDFICIGPDGKPFRPWVTVWEDVRSGVCVGFALVEAPNSTSIFVALKRGIERYGIPEHILIDNGKDYRSKDLAGGRTSTVRFEVGVGHTYSLVERLRCEPHFAIPYNARSKPAERMFREWKEDFSKGWESFCGGNVLEKPERLASLVKRRSGLPTFVDVEERLFDWVEHVYNRRARAGDGLPRIEVHQARLEELRTAPPDALALLCMRTRGPYKVGRNGIKVFDPYWFDSPDLDDLRGSDVQVLAHYDPLFIGKVHVADTTGRVLCVATCRDLANWMGGEAQYKAFKAEERARYRKNREVLDHLAEQEFGDPVQRLIDKGKAAAESAAAEPPRHPAPTIRPVQMVRAMEGLTRPDGDPVAERERQRDQADRAMRILLEQSA